MDNNHRKICENYVQAVKESIAYSEALIKHSRELIALHEQTIKTEAERIRLEKIQLEKYEGGIASN